MPSIEFTPLPSAKVVPETLKVSDIIGLPAFAGCVVEAGLTGLTSAVDHVNVMQIPTDRFAKPNALLLASEQAVAGTDVGGLISALAAKRVSGLVLRSEDVDPVLGEHALRVADDAGMPIIRLPLSTHLSDAQTAVLEDLLEKRAAGVKAAANVREALSSSALKGGGTQALAETLAAHMGAAVWIIDSDGPVLAASHEDDVAAFAPLVEAYMASDMSGPAAADAFLFSAISAPNRRLGCVVCALAPPLGHVQLAALEHGTRIAAVQILHRQSADEARTRFRSGFIRDLLSGTLDARSRSRRAESIDWDPDTAYRIVLLKPGPQQAQVATALGAQVEDALITNHAGGVLLMVPARAFSTAEQLIRALAAGDEGACVGVSAIHNDLAGVTIAVEQAEEALRAAARFGTSDRVRRFEQLGPLRFLTAVPRAELQRFVNDNLQPLNELEEEYRTALEETLRHLIRANLNVAQAARDGGWHYNTVRYRIERLTELLGPFMDDGTILDSITLALLLRDEIISV